jgi:hypothetical protein
MRVVFVGDRPSRLNYDPETAFVGTPSFTNLCKWIAKMHVTDFVMVNSYSHGDVVNICVQKNSGERKFVALGNKASERLKDMDIEHFKLPHPSPRNRKLNNKKLIDSELRKCYDYLKG